ncbi:hypothetical protein M422DRAFT_54645 [Sphaerobolus stellatus SS14]|uniref:Uncharacterized protein n=1 Tax=Sphaerobolus stellatus (strain SS14) TaxID=990650 RepID=A0A0C9U2E6_SPHS4|nr:hypothetical protein M422DRAFT_54645 [Sphaerobolus stellatus SS14]
MEAELRTDLKIKDENVEWLYISTSINGAADEPFGSEVFSPEPSFLKNKGKRKVDTYLMNNDNEDIKDIPIDPQLVEPERKRTRALVSITADSEGQVMEETITTSELSVLSMGNNENVSGVTSLVRSASASLSAGNGSYMSKPDNSRPVWPLFSSQKTSNISVALSSESSIHTMNHASSSSSQPPQSQPSSSLEILEHSSIGTMASLPKESRTQATFSTLTGSSSGDAVENKEICNSSQGHFRFCALRLEYSWTTKMTDKEWVEAAKLYNDPNTHISPQYYSSSREYPPQDEYPRDALF